jgi:hypothetical protein
MEDKTLNVTDEFLSDIFDNVEEIEVTPSVSKKTLDSNQATTPDKTADAKSSVDETLTDGVTVENQVIDNKEKDDNIDDLYEEGDDQIEDTTDDKKTTKKPGRKNKDDVFSREEALRAAAKRFGGIFGVTDEEVSFEDLDEEGIVDFVDQLASQLKESTYNNLRDSDNITRDLLDFKEKGGDPLDILELYKKQDDLEKMSIDSEQGQKQIIGKFLKETLNWSNEEVEDHIEILAASEKLEKEATRLKGKFDTHYESEKTAKFEKQSQIQKRELSILNEKRTKFQEVLQQNKINKKEVDNIQKLAFGQGRLPDGKIIDLIDYKIAQIQKDPSQYLDLVRFINNKEEFLSSKQQEIVNQTNNNSFKKALDIQTRRKQEAIPSSEKTKQKFNFDL